MGTFKTAGVICGVNRNEKIMSRYKEGVMENTKLNLWDRIMMAITFAEAGEDTTAREILGKRTESEKQSESRTRKESGKRPKLQM